MSLPPGVYPDLSNDDYHNDSAISRTGLMVYKESPFKFWSRYINPNNQEKKVSKVMEFGSAVHSFVLEPYQFHKEYMVELDLPKLPKVGLLKNLGRPEFDRQKAERARIEFENNMALEGWKELAEGKKTISLEDYWKILNINLALKQHNEARDLVFDADAYETSYFWKDEETGLMLKARPDILHKNMIVDLKTCRSASPRAYQHAMANEGYHIQAALIQTALYECEERQIDNCLNVCIETEFPFEIGVKVISEEALKVAHSEIRDLLNRMKVSFEKNHWPSYAVEEVNLPQWY
jgi:hypothetical protein